MYEPVKIALAVVVAWAGVGLLHLASSDSEPSPEPPQSVQIQEADLARSMSGVDYDRLVESITALAVTQGDDGYLQVYGPVDTLHRALLDYVGNRLGLDGGQRAMLMEEYTAASGAILLDYQQMMGEMTSDSIATPSEAAVSYNAYSCVNQFVGIFSGQACGLLSFPGISSLKHASGLVDGAEVSSALDVRRTCKNIIREAITPIANNLRRKAVIRDLNTSRMSIESQVRSMVVELATAEERLSADFTDLYQTKFLFMTSEAVLRARADAIVKVGFNLNKRFSIEMDHDQRRLTIRLPEPEILSNEVDVEFIDVKNGALVKIDREKYNAALQHAREMMDEHVAGSTIFVTAKHNARRIIQTVFQPMMALPEFRYEVTVLFPRGYSAPEPIGVVEAAG